MKPLSDRIVNALNDPADKVRLQVLKTLRILNLSEEYLIPIIKSLTDISLDVKKEALNTLEKVQPTKVDPFLSVVELLAGTDWRISNAAMEALEHIPLQDGGRVLYETVLLRITHILDSKNGYNYSDRLTAAITLDKIGSSNKNVLLAWAKGLEDPDPHLRGMVRGSLKRVPSKDPEVLEMLDNHDANNLDI